MRNPDEIIADYYASLRTEFNSSVATATPDEITQNAGVMVMTYRECIDILTICTKEAKVEYTNTAYQLGYQTAIDVLLASQKVLKKMDVSTKN
jgi:hypothetical protein